MTSVNIDNLATLVRYECGSPTEQDLPLAIIRSKIKYACNEILNRVGFTSQDFEIRTIDTVAGQQSYQIPGSFEVVQVFWGGTDAPSAVQFPGTMAFRNIPNSYMEPLADYHRSDYLLNELVRNQLDSTYQTEIIGDKIYLYPVPVESGLKITIMGYESIQNDLRIDQRYERAALLYSTADCCLYLSNRYRHYAVPMRNGGLTDNTKSAEYAAQAKQYRDEYDNQMLSLA